jgi:apolipoprotein N-acyltransferase
VIDPYGHILSLSRFGAPEVLTTTIFPSRTQTPYLRWGDAVVWIAIVFVIVISFFRINWLRKINEGGQS